MKRILAALAAVLVLVSCGGSGGERGRADGGDTLRPLYEARYAQRFELLEDDRGPVLRVLDPWQGADSVVYDYRLVPDTTGTVALSEGEIRWPIRRAVCMSSSHVAFLDAVERVEVVKGVSGLDFITNPAVHAAGVKDVGHDNNLNYEMIVALRPDVVFVYGVSGENSALTGKLRQLGIPVVYIADYLENDPLGRAEWIVPFGLLTGRTEQAVELFLHTEHQYKELGELVAGAAVSAGRLPKVMLNSPYKDVWYLPGDRSYMIQLLRDAGADYLGKGEDTDVSRPVSAERALLLMMEADYWLNPGMVQTMAQLKADNGRFATLPVVRSGRVYNNNARTTAMGGSDFWESGVVRPDVVLEDLVRILHPELGDLVAGAFPDSSGLSAAALSPSAGGLYYFHQLK